MRVSGSHCNDSGRELSLSRSMLAPRDSLMRLDRTEAGPGAAQLRLWAWLAGIALLGSLVFGASLGIVLPRRSAGRVAAWLTLSAAAGWCAFGPALILITRRRAATCLHSCLVTMAYGEVVLATAAVGNTLLALTGLAGRMKAAWLNLCWVVLSNLVMGLAMVLQMDAVGVPKGRVFFLWMAVLNGVGGAFSWMLRGLVKERN